MAKEEQRTDVEEVKQAPSSVSLPVCRPDYPSLKVSGEDSEEGMSPSNMWQVYALGSFLVLRWIWAKWRERKSRNSGEGPTNLED